MLKTIQKIRCARRDNIPLGSPKVYGVTKQKREQEIIISLTSHPHRIGSAYLTVQTLLQQDMKPDRVILWLAREQFPKTEKLPPKLLRLKKYGLEIRWYHDIRSYKKLVPTLKEFPEAIVVTVDDDIYYPRHMLRVLVEEFRNHPDEVICHAVTHPILGEDGLLHINPEPGDYRGTSSYLNKMLGGTGTLYTARLLDPDIFNEVRFMAEAPTNDDIYFWAMAVKKGTKIRLAQDALATAWMTDVDNQLQTSLGLYNLENNLYERVNNRILELYPEILTRLQEEQNISTER